MARTSFVDVALRLRGARRFNAEVAAATKQLDQLGVRGAKSLGGFAQRAGRLKDVGRSLTTGLTLPIAAIGGASVYAAMKWESAFAGVEKTVDATQPQLQSLNDELLAMSQRIPVSAVELASIAEAAGQLGIQTDNIAAFTAVMANLGVATNMTSTDAAEQLARFANITQMPQSQFERLGSTVVALGNNLAATETDIVGMGMRIAGAGNQIGLTESQIMSFAGALSSVGIRAEMGGTAISTAFLEANSAVISGGVELEKWSAIAGMSAVDFRKKWEANAGLAMADFLEGLGRLSRDGVDVKKRLEELGLSGMRIRDVLMRASGAGDLLRESLALGAEAWGENSALQEEASKRYATFESRLQILKNTLFATGVILGDTFLPPLLALVNFVAPKILAFAKFFQRLPKPIKVTVVAMILFAAVLGPIIWMLGAFAHSVGVLIVVLNRLIAAKIFTGLVAAALKFRFLQLLTAVKVLTVAFVRMALAALANPYVLLAIAIVAVGAALVYAYLKVESFRKFVQKNWQMIAAIMTGGLSRIVISLVQGFGRMVASGRSAVAFIRTTFTGLVNFFRTLPARLASTFSGMFDGLKDAFSNAVDFIVQKWEDLKSRVPDIGGALGSIVPGLAMGGTITRPGTVLVGERGPELLNLPRAASVIPLSGPNRAIGGPQRIEVPVYLNGRQIALAVAGEVADARARS